MNTAQLWQAHALGSGEAREALLNEHLTLVHHVVRQVSPMLSTRHDRDELVSYGTIGLIDALDSFDPGRGLAFSTYAVPRIRGAILDELRRQDHVPRSVRRKTRALAGARETLSRLFGRAPENRELAEYLGVDIETLWRWQTDAASAVKLSIDDSVGDQGAESLTAAEALHASAEPTIEDELTRDQEIAIMTECLRELKEQERQVLVLYYHEELKMHEIAAVLGVTESRISQIRSRALAKLRARMAPLRTAAPAR